MKEIGISLTLLRTIYVPDNSTVEEIEKAVDNDMAELSLDRNIVNDIEWELSSNTRRYTVCGSGPDCKLGASRLT